MSYIAFETVVSKASLSKDELLPDVAFDKGAGRLKSNPKFRGPLVRRPYMGIVLKERRPAYLSVIETKTGKAVMVQNSIAMAEGDAHPAIAGDRFFTDFTLLSIQEKRQEKAQVIETFGESFVFMFGEKPRILQATGVLLNTTDFNWRAQFWDNYDRYFRGTRLVERQAKAWLGWDDILVGGYMLSATAADSAQSPHAISFTFMMLVSDYVSIGVGDFSGYKAFELTQYHKKALAAETSGGRAADMASLSGKVDLSAGMAERQLSLMDKGESIVKTLGNVLKKRGPGGLIKSVAAQPQAIAGHYGFDMNNPRKAMVVASGSPVMKEVERKVPTGSLPGLNKTKSLNKVYSGGLSGHTMTKLGPVFS